mmetsp:Transcript_54620/g.97472  ORF Transcript_54620/g.97472 Transcript_54620/m.97472 type:complete len:577 (+) Transcript_54620:35-1765(+)
MAKKKAKAQGVVVKAPGAAKSSGNAKKEPVQADPEAAEPTAVAEASKGPERGRKKKRKRSAASVQEPAVEEAAEDEDEAEEAMPAASSGRGNLGNLTFDGSSSKGLLPPMGPWSKDSSKVELEAGLAWLVWPMTPVTFLSEYWEKKPLHLKRQRSDFYEGLFSKADFDGHLKEGTEVRYGERLNLARFDKDKAQKVDLNGPQGTPAKWDEVQKEWTAGATMQVMHPQQVHLPVRSTLASLERSFGALFGANAYLTPSEQQGLAPHFDDVEVFMLQLEGSKRWKLHEPPEGEEYPLPRDYSRDFKPDELGPLILECVLEQGDLLYLPRGTVHSGVTEATAGFSHHLTLSTYQRTSWFQVLEKALSSALERAAGESSEFREGLPLNYIGTMGSWHEIGSEHTGPNSSGGRRAAFLRRFQGLLSRLQEFVDLDEVCDEFAVDFMAQRLPPPSASSASESTPAPEAEGITLESKVRWTDPNSVRPILSTDPETSEAQVLLFHSCSNQCGKHMCVDTESDEDVGCLRYEAATFLPALRYLCAAGSSIVRCGDLPLSDEGDRVALCENLVEAGCLELVPADA